MTKDPSEIAEQLSEAQRRYLRELEPNRISGQEAYSRDIERRFQNRGFRKRIKGNSLATAHARAMEELVVLWDQQRPVECGWHYVELSPLGLAVRKHLEKNNAR